MRKLLCVAALFGGSLLPLAPTAVGAPVVVTRPLSLPGRITGTTTMVVTTIIAIIIAAIGTIANR